MRAAVGLVVARRPAPRRRRSRSRSARAPRGRRATSGRRRRPRAHPRRSPPRRGPGAGSRQPKKFGCWKIDAGRVRRRLAELVRVGDALAMRHLDDLEPEARRVGLHDLADLRVHGLAEHDLRAAGDVLRDVAGVRGDRRAVVARGVRDVHPGQLADDRLVLEDRLEDALAHLGLVRRVRGQELAARHERVDERRDVVVVDPGAEEGELPARVRRFARRARPGARRAPARTAPARGRARRWKRRPSGMSRKSSSTEATPTAASISVAVALGEREERELRSLLLEQLPVRVRRRGGRRPRPGRRAGS